MFEVIMSSEEGIAGICDANLFLLLHTKQSEKKEKEVLLDT